MARDHKVALMDNIASIIRGVVLLVATIMSRTQGLGMPDAGLDLFLALGAVYVLLSAVIGRVVPRHRPETAALVALDIFYITGLVWRTGGVVSEYYLLYYLPILHASMRLDFRHAIASSILAASCYGLVMVAAGLGSMVVSSAAVQLATFGGSALVLALFFGTVAVLSRSERELRQKLEHAVERLSALYRIARAVHARDSLQSVVDTTLELAMEMVHGAAGYLALSNQAGELLVKCSRASNEPADAAPAAFDRHLAQHCAVQRAPVVIDARGAEAQAGSCAASVPLLFGDRVYGALQIFKHALEPFSEHELELLQALCQEAAVAIENAHLLTEVHRLSVTDELTGLYHRSEFGRQLAAEVDRARLRQTPLALLLFDVDGMRRINAEHGHQAGDEVLVGFADLLRRYIRAQDIAARYSGDEFAVLLPGGGLEAARAVASRLCHAMAQREFRFAGEDEAHHFTLCVGAVAALEMPEVADQLIGRADEALFEARQAGPGQVRFWEPAAKRSIMTQMRHIVEQVQRECDEEWR